MHICTNSSTCTNLVQIKGCGSGFLASDKIWAHLWVQTVLHRCQEMRCCIIVRRKSSEGDFSSNDAGDQNHVHLSSRASCTFITSQIPNTINIYVGVIHSCILVWITPPLSWRFSKRFESTFSKVHPLDSGNSVLSVEMTQVTQRW